MASPEEKRKIFAVLIILGILLLVVLGLRWQRQLTLDSIRQTSTKTDIYYQLTLSKKSVKVGERIGVSASFTAVGRKISGADIILHFDPTFIQADNNLTLSPFFDSYPRKEVNNEKGFVKITGFSPKNSGPLTGSIQILTISFEAKKSGSTTVWFDFQPGRTNLTTLVEEGTSKNILERVEDGIVRVEP